MFRFSLYFHLSILSIVFFLEFTSCSIECKNRGYEIQVQPGRGFIFTFVHCYMRKQMIQCQFLSLITCNLDHCHFTNLMVYEEIWDLYCSSVIFSISGVQCYSKFGNHCLRVSFDTLVQKWDVKNISNPHQHLTCKIKNAWFRV